jgi:regulator of replication initiation timing
MSSIENNVIRSFELVRKDVMSLQSQINALGEAQDKVLDLIRQLRLYENELQARVSKLESSREEKPQKHSEAMTARVTAKRLPKHYVGTKSGKLFHIENCPFAQNIKPMNRVKFKSKVKALNQGLKPCKCVQKS